MVDTTTEDRTLYKYKENGVADRKAVELTIGLCEKPVVLEQLRPQWVCSSISSQDFEESSPSCSHQNHRTAVTPELIIHITKQQLQ